MKKSLFVLSILSILLLMISTAATPMNLTGVSLIDVDFHPGKGIVLRFNILGDTKGDFSGVINISGREYNMDCNVNDSGILVCVAAGGVGQYSGQAVSGAINGFPFSANLPAKYSCNWWSYTSYGFMVDDVDGDGLDETVQYYYTYNVPDFGQIADNLDRWGETLLNKECQTSTKDSFSFSESVFGEYQGYDIVVNP